MSTAVSIVIDARARDIEGFKVGRVLPTWARRMVGPFIFFDHMGPAELAPGHGMDIRPHPHIGLATVTYLFEGEIVHRDSVGSLQTVRPGEINWMTAGSGIAHSERTSPELRRSGSKLHGVQLWVALPRAYEETEPSFHHHAADSLPAVELPGARVRVLAGSAYGESSPVRTYSTLFYADAAVSAGGELPLPPPDEHVERAVYVIAGAITCDGERAERGRMLVFTPGAEVSLRAEAASRVMLVGGAPFAEPRHIYWNFVSSSKERIEQAKLDWTEGRFAKVPGDEIEFVPLPR